MDSNETVYTYSMHVSGLKNPFTETITVEHPGEPTHNCPTMVREGSFVNCSCNSSKAGNPPAETVWVGVMTKTLHIRNIQRQDKTKAYTCRLMWGSDGEINRSTLYTFEVAYGPSSVHIESIIDETANEIESLRLICTAVDVYPSAIFGWNITCDNQTQTNDTSTCTVSTANLSQEAVVTCRAINNVFPDMSFYASFVVDFTDGKSRRPKKLSPNDIPRTSLIGVYIVLCIFVLIIFISVTAVGVYKCRRKAKMSNCPESPFLSSSPDAAGYYQGREHFLVAESAPGRNTSFSYDVGTTAIKEKSEKDAKCSNDSLQSSRLTECDEPGEKSTPERCAAPSGDFYTIPFKRSDDRNKEKSDQNNSTIEALKEGAAMKCKGSPCVTFPGGASDFTQDETDMLGLYSNEVKFVKRPEPMRYTGVLGDIYTSADKEKKERDAKCCQGPPQLIRSVGFESDSQSAFQSCVASSIGLYVNVSKTYNRQENENGAQHSLGLEAVNEDMNKPTTSNTMETTLKSGKSVIDSGMYLPPFPHQNHEDDTYSHLMAR